MWLSIMCAVALFWGSITSHQTDMDFNRLIRMQDPQLLPYAYNQYNTVQQSAHHNATDLHQRKSNQTNGNQSNPQLYKAKEDPSLFYKNRRRPSMYYTDDERSNLVGPESWRRVSDNRIRYRQKGVVKIPYHGAVVNVKPNMTHYYRTDTIKTKHLNSRHRSHTRTGGSVGRLAKPCVRCPSERTLVSTLGQDKVLLEAPEVLSCTGKPLTHKGIQIKSTYGPKFNTLIKAGSHIIISEIFYRNEKLKYCQYRVHVVTHNCPVNDHLSAVCDISTLDADGILCNFSCKDKSMELRGSSALKCSDSLEWRGNLPTCQQRTWCEFPLAPDNGSLRCNANTFAGNRLAEGSKCRALCERGYVARPRLTACRRGQWTSAVVCKRRRRHARQPHQ